MLTVDEWSDGYIWPEAKSAKYWAEHPDEIRSFANDIIREHEDDYEALIWLRNELDKAILEYGLEPSWGDWCRAHIKEQIGEDEIAE